jgi:hypothetical protein
MRECVELLQSPPNKLDNLASIERVEKESGFENRYERCSAIFAISRDLDSGEESSVSTLASIFALRKPQIATTPGYLIDYQCLTNVEVAEIPYQSTPL